MNIDHDLIERICEAFDPGAHPLLADFKDRMSPDDWETLTSDYRRRVRASVEYIFARKATAQRMVELGVATPEAAESWVRPDIEDFDFLHSVGDDPAMISIVDRFDQDGLWRENLQRAKRQIAREVTGDEEDLWGAVHVLGERWGQALEAAGGHDVSENPLHAALMLLEDLADKSAYAGRIVDLSEHLLEEASA